MIIRKYLSAAALALVMAIAPSAVAGAAPITGCTISGKKGVLTTPSDGYYTETVVPFTVKNSGTDNAKAILTYVNFPTVSADVVKQDGSYYGSGYIFGRSNGQAYLYATGSGIVLPAGATSTFYVKLRTNTTVNNSPFGATLDSGFPNVNHAQCGGSLPLYTADVAPKDTIWPTGAAGTVVNGVKQQVSNNIVPLLVLMGLVVGLGVAVHMMSRQFAHQDAVANGRKARHWRRSGNGHILS